VPAAAAASGTVDLDTASPGTARVPLHGPFHLCLDGRFGGCAKSVSRVHLRVRPACGDGEGRVRLDQEWRAKGSGGDGGSTEPSLDELARKLSELRLHLEQVLTGSRADGSGTEERNLRCHACGRVGSAEEAGWTLRLCADDELHAFCPDCDRRPVDGERGVRVPGSTDG
jgi:hypothetical protein